MALAPPGPWKTFGPSEERGRADPAQAMRRADESGRRPLRVNASQRGTSLTNTRHNCVTGASHHRVRFYFFKGTTLSGGGPPCHTTVVWNA